MADARNTLQAQPLRVREARIRRDEAAKLDSGLLPVARALAELVLADLQRYPAREAEDEG